MIENRFLHFQTKQAFENISDSVSQNSIVFIDKDSSNNPLIWTHGKYYYCNRTGSTTGSVGTLDTTTTQTSLAVKNSESFEDNIKLHAISKTGQYADLLGVPDVLANIVDDGLKTINGTSLIGNGDIVVGGGGTTVVANPSTAASTQLNKVTIANTTYSIGAVGSLSTDNSTSLQTRSGESFANTINLNRIAKTGSYKHLVDLPTGTLGNFLAFDDDGGFMDSGYSSSNFYQKAANFTEGDFLAFTKQGGIVDSGKKASDFQTTLDSQTAYTSVGNSTTIPVITTNSLGQVTHISTADLDLTNYLTKAQGDALIARIDYLYAQLVGITVTASPTTIMAGEDTDITISISTDETMDAVTVSRDINGVTTSNVYTGSSGDSWSFVDTVSPQQSGSITYTVIATKEVTGQPLVTKSAIVTISIGNKTTVNISYSKNEHTVYIGRTPYNYPTLIGANGLTIRYTSSDTNYATINQSGNITLVGPGDTTITAHYDGDSTHASTNTSYTLHVRQDAIYDVEWTGGVEKSTLYHEEPTLLLYGEIILRWLSGHVDTIDGNRNNVMFAAANGTILGTTYTAPPSGNSDTITVLVSYTGGTERIEIPITVQTAPEPEPEPEPITSGHLFTASSSDANANLQQLTWKDEGEFVNNWTGMIYNVDDGYIFLKISNQDTISDLIVNPSYESFMYHLPLEQPINTNDGYLVYRTSDQLMYAGNTEYKIVK